MHRIFLIAAAAVAFSGKVQAGIPLFLALCGNEMEVHAFEGGPIYMNGEIGKFKKLNENHFEATDGRATVSVRIKPDGSAAVFYTDGSGADWVCGMAEISN